MTRVNFPPKAWCVPCGGLRYQAKSKCVICGTPQGEKVRPPKGTPDHEVADTLALSMFPATPPSNGNPDSDAAAASLTPADLDQKQRVVLRCVWRHREVGIIDQGIDVSTGLGENTVRPRRGELWQLGWIEARDAQTREPIRWSDDAMVRARRLKLAMKGQTKSGKSATLWFPSERTARAVAQKPERQEAA